MTVKLKGKKRRTNLAKILGEVVQPENPTRVRCNVCNRLIRKEHSVVLFKMIIGEECALRFNFSSRDDIFIARFKLRELRSRKMKAFFSKKALQKNP